MNSQAATQPHRPKTTVESLCSTGCLSDSPEDKRFTLLQPVLPTLLHWLHIIHYNNNLVSLPQGSWTWVRVMPLTQGALSSEHFLWGATATEDICYLTLGISFPDCNWDLQVVKVSPRTFLLWLPLKIKYITFAIPNIVTNAEKLGVLNANRHASNEKAPDSPVRFSNAPSSWLHICLPLAPPQTSEAHLSAVLVLSNIISHIRGTPRSELWIISKMHGAQWQ